MTRAGRSGHPHIEDSPRWSPDGETIAFYNLGEEVTDPQFSATADVWTVPVAGGEPTRLTTSPGPSYSPDYSPDGSQIVSFPRAEV